MVSDWAIAVAAMETDANTDSNFFIIGKSLGLCHINKTIKKLKGYITLYICHVNETLPPIPVVSGEL